MKWLIPFSLAVLMTGCAGNFELPKNAGEGTDKLKPSPCACLKVPFNSEGYTWAG
ncbi:conserved protein [Tepidicaulis marinus]|jgi:hypothetical protein|uniref:Conserved protein n=1 Tax=Tepidicaulis marinus TaxID=1333998 RepID=A0A081B660_9HYPH|nr:hypothetical protein [Tepidicaulis marinus]GAK43528.1 conserved protein [Tepidicaulis marinus]